MIALEAGEQIVKVVRRHPIVLLPMVLAMALLAAAPLLLDSLLLSGFFPIGADLLDALQAAVAEWRFFAYSLWLLVLWVIFFTEWTDYYLDLWIITDKRIIDVEQKGFFNRQITSFSFSQIQDITVETCGFIETLLRFGTLHIQTAGHNVEIIIRDAHYPEDARSLILKLSEQSKSTAGL